MTPGPTVAPDDRDKTRRDTDCDDTARAITRLRVAPATEPRPAATPDVAKPRAATQEALALDVAPTSASKSAGDADEAASRRTVRRRSKHSDAVRAEALRLVTDGETLRDVADQLGVSKDAVWRWTQDAKPPTPEPRTAPAHETVAVWSRRVVATLSISSGPRRPIRAWIDPFPGVAIVSLMPRPDTAHRHAGMLAAAITGGALLILSPAHAYGQEPPAPPLTVPAEATPNEAAPTIVPTTVEVPPLKLELAPAVEKDASSSIPTAVVTGLVGGVSAILGVAITQFGAFRLSRRQRRGDRTIAQLDELRSMIGDLDDAYVKAVDAAAGSPESRDLDNAIRKYERARRMVEDATTQRLATTYHEKLRTFIVEQGDDEVESPTTRVDVDNASDALIDRIRTVWSDVD